MTGLLPNRQGLAAQTVHQKPFIGGELGRMARRIKGRERALPRGS